MDCLTIKDFAGPVATVIAALTAVGVTGYFARQQSRTAERQAETALDQLRNNLFERRYAVYDEVKKLLRTMLNDIGKLDFRAFVIAQHFIVLDEAIFFFSSETCQWIMTVRGDCQAFLEAEAARREGTDNTADYVKLQSKLLGHFKTMPERFRRELSFRQLTQ